MASNEVKVCDHRVIWVITNIDGILYTCNCHLLDCMVFSGQGRSDRVYDPSKLCGANRTFPANVFTSEG
jgi:hypothetical protein